MHEALDVRRSILVAIGLSQRSEFLLQAQEARLYLNRRFDVDSRASLSLLLDEWNRSKLFPKAYTVLPDDGRVGICAEQCYDFETGATRAQLKYTIGLWIDMLLRFGNWVDEQV